MDTLELLGFSETGSKIGDKVADRGALNNEARPLVVGFHGCNVLFDDCVLAPKEDSGLAVPLPLQCREWLSQMHGFQT